MTHPDLDPWAGMQPREQTTDFRLDQRIAAQDALAHEQDEKIHWLETQIKDLQEKLISHDVRIKVLESLDAQADTDEFAYFWKQYPRKVGKGHARKAFEKACKKASFDTIMDGLNRYKKDKPDETPWKHPQTWLNSEGWEDNWTDVVERVEVGQKPNPDRVIRDKLTELLGERKKAAMLYNAFLNARDRVKLFEAAFNGNLGCRHSINEACAGMGYDPIKWQRVEWE